MPSNSNHSLGPTEADVQDQSAHGSVNGLVLEQYGQGFAWFRPSEEPAEDDEALYVLTDLGRHDLRIAELFGCSPEP